jgi:conjugal transfer mating pair stabilization protein TraG
MSEDTRNIITASISSGKIPFLSRTGGKAQLMTTGKNGETVSFSISEDVARNFENTASQVHSESMQQTLQDSNSLDYMTKLAKQIGATEAYSYLNDARELRTSTESYGSDLTTALVRNYASERYGNATPENIRRAIGDFNHYLTQQGRQGVDNMHNIINGFVSGNGYGWGNTTNAVHGAMAVTKARVQDSDQFVQEVGSGAMEAGSKTFSINEENFSKPSAAVPLNNPNVDAVTDPADAIHRRNRLEESGKGGIHTTAGGIVKEMAGAEKHQPISPTSSLYRNEDFYNQGNLVELQPRTGGGIVLPSGTILRGDENYTVTTGNDLLKGSVFEKK